MLCNGHWDNLWSIKGILRGFELAFGLNVNLSKIRIYGINLKEDFIYFVATFLACDVGTLPFNFLEWLLASVPEG